MSYTSQNSSRPYQKECSLFDIDMKSMLRLNKQSEIHWTKTYFSAKVTVLKSQEGSMYLIEHSVHSR